MPSVASTPHLRRSDPPPRVEEQLARLARRSRAGVTQFAGRGARANAIVAVRFLDVFERNDGVRTVGQDAAGRECAAPRRAESRAAAACPIGIAPAMRRATRAPRGLATAKPSIVDRALGGIGSRARAASARIRPSASSSGTDSPRRGERDAREEASHGGSGATRSPAANGARRRKDEIAHDGRDPFRHGAAGRARTANARAWPM